MKHSRGVTGAGFVTLLAFVFASPCPRSDEINVEEVSNRRAPTTSLRSSRAIIGNRGEKILAERHLGISMIQFHSRGSDCAANSDDAARSG